MVCDTKATLNPTVNLSGLASSHPKSLSAEDKGQTAFWASILPSLMVPSLKLHFSFALPLTDDSPV